MEQVLGNLASIVGPLLLVGFALMLAGVMGRVGSGSISWDDLGTEAVAGLALLIVFCMLMATVSSSEWGEVFGALCGGIPIVDAIADYGSYRDVLQQDLRSAVVAFVDTFIMCLLMNLFKLLPHDFRRRSRQLRYSRQSTAQIVYWDGVRHRCASIS